MSEFIADKTFSGVDFTKEKLAEGTYEDCIFTDCKFSDQNLSGFKFLTCSIGNCDLSNAKLGNTVFREVTFKNCKMLGLHFEHCNDLIFSVNFETCQLDFSSFYRRNLKNSNFKNCRLHEVDFAEANLSGATIESSDLSGAQFDHTNLEKADLRNSFNFTIDPESNRIQKAKFSALALHGLLRKYNIVVE